MFFYQYYLEIKNRLLLLFLTWITTVLASYCCKETLLFIVVNPTICYFKEDFYIYFMFTDATEVFSVFVHIVLFFSNQIAIISLIYHLLVFILPGLFKVEYYTLKFFLKTIVFMFFSLTISFNSILLPLSWNFFLSFQEFVTVKSIVLHFEARLNEYLRFYTELYFICIFYYLIIMFFFFIFFKRDNNFLTTKKFRKSFYYFFLLISTLLTPPDIFSQVLISTLIIFVYELIFFSFLLKNFSKQLVR